MKINTVYELTEPSKSPKPAPGSSLCFSVDSAYAQALARIEQLEGELQQKNTALDTLLKEQQRLRDSLQMCVQTLQKMTQQVNCAGREIKNDYRQFLERIAALEQENQALKGSNDVWSNRALTLEFDLLTAEAENNQMKAFQDLAVSLIALQDIVLKTVNTEHHQPR